MTCYSCHNEIKLEGRISRTEECPSCGADIHCCLNCINYDTTAHNRCRESQAEWVSDRERANFCDYFNPNILAGKDQSRGAAIKEGRNAFENLFKK